MAYRRGISKLLLEKLMHKAIDFCIIVKERLACVIGKAQYVIVCQEHTGKQRPFVENAGNMVIVTACFKGRAGQKRRQQLFQAAQIVAVIIIAVSIKANYVLDFCFGRKPCHGCKAFIQILIIGLRDKAYVSVGFLQLHFYKGAHELIDVRLFFDDLQR